MVIWGKLPSDRVGLHVTRETHTYVFMQIFL